MDGVELHFLLGPVISNTPGGLWREVEKRADCAACALARPQFQHLTKEDKNRDDRCGLEVDGNRAVGASEGGREQPRGEDGEDAGHQPIRQQGEGQGVDDGGHV